MNRVPLDNFRIARDTPAIVKQANGFPSSHNRTSGPGYLMGWCAASGQSQEGSFQAWAAFCLLRLRASILLLSATHNFNVFGV
jgi:hypothetical protein